MLLQGPVAKSGLVPNTAIHFLSLAGPSSLLFPLSFYFSVSLPVTLYRIYDTRQNSSLHDWQINSSLGQYNGRLYDMFLGADTLSMLKDLVYGTNHDIL